MHEPEAMKEIGISKRHYLHVLQQVMSNIELRFREVSLDVGFRRDSGWVSWRIGDGLGRGDGVCWGVVLEALAPRRYICRSLLGAPALERLTLVPHFGAG